MSLLLPLPLLVMVGVVPARGIAVIPASDQVTCPGAATVTAVVGEQLGWPEVEGESPWTLRYSVEPGAPTDGAGEVQLSLQDPQGQVRLNRRLPVTPDACDEAARAMALMVERFFRGVQWTSGTPLPRVLPPPAPPPAEAARPVTVDRAPPPAAPRTAAVGFALAAGPGVQIDGTSAIGLGVIVALRPWRSLVVDLGLMLSAAERSESLGTAGQLATSRRSSGRLSVGWSWGGAWWRASAGPSLLAAYDGGETTGITQPDRNGRWVTAAGLGAGLKVPLSSRWSVRADAAGYRTLYAQPFAVRTPAGDREVLEAPSLQALGSLALELTLFP